jgi:hypothetical protein
MRVVAALASLAGRRAAAAQGVAAQAAQQTLLARQGQLTQEAAAAVQAAPVEVVLAEQAVQALLSLDHSTLLLQLRVLLL